MSVDANRTPQNTVAPLPTFEKRRRWQQPRFPERLYCDSLELPVCPSCSQKIDRRKITQKEKVESMKDTTETITGVVVLTMPDGTEHRVPAEKVLALLGKVQRTLGPQPRPIPGWLYVKYPALTWFRDCLSAKSEDSHAHELLLNMVRGPLEKAS